MKMRFLTLIIVSFPFSYSFCQNNTNVTKNDSIVPQPTISHKVELGETIIMIARKYHVTPKDIYLLNPDATQGITQNTVLQLPADKVRMPEGKKSAKHQDGYAASSQ